MREFYFLHAISTCLKLRRGVAVSGTLQVVESSHVSRVRIFTTEKLVDIFGATIVANW